MEIHNFEELKKHISVERKKRAVVAAAHDEHTLEAVFRASDEGLISYLLIGNKREITKIAESLGHVLQNGAVMDTESDEESAFKAVEAVRLGKADFIVKGYMQTSVLLKAVVNKETGIGQGRSMSHVAVLDMPSYHKILAVTDGGMVIAPDIHHKKDIFVNALELFGKLGYEKPKVGILCAVEKPNSKMQETLDAQEIKEWAEKERLNCCVEGPISFDLAVEKRAAEIKKYNSPVAGDADILLVPDITAGNAICKALYCLGGAMMAGCVVGAKVPIALNSRGAAFEEKYDSILLCAKMSC